MEIFSFNGKAKRGEYWAVMIGAIVGLVLGIAFADAGMGAIFALIILIASLWVLVATTVRRLRDAGLHTAWIIAIFVPYVSFIASIVFGCIGSSKEDEK